MTSGELDALQSRAMALQGQVDSMLAAYRQQLSAAAAARESLAASRIDGWSADRLVRVTANAAGVPLETWVDPQRRSRVTAEQLAAAMTEASQAAARAARAQLDATTAPMAAAAQQFDPAALFADLPELAKPVTDLLPPAPPLAAPLATPASRYLEEPDFLQQWQPATPAAAPEQSAESPAPAPAAAPPAKSWVSSQPYGVGDEEDEPVWKGLNNNNDWW